MRCLRFINIHSSVPRLWNTSRVWTRRVNNGRHYNVKRVHVGFSKRLSTATLSSCHILIFGLSLGAAGLAWCQMQLRKLVDGVPRGCSGDHLLMFMTTIHRASSAPACTHPGLCWSHTVSIPLQLFSVPYCVGRFVQSLVFPVRFYLLTCPYQWHRHGGIFRP